MSYFTELLNIYLPKKAAGISTSIDYVNQNVWIMFTLFKNILLFVLHVKYIFNCSKPNRSEKISADSIARICCTILSKANTFKMNIGSDETFSFQTWNYSFKSEFDRITCNPPNATFLFACSFPPNCACKWLWDVESSICYFDGSLGHRCDVYLNCTYMRIGWNSTTANIAICNFIEVPILPWHNLRKLIGGLNFPASFGSFIWPNSLSSLSSFCYCMYLHLLVIVIYRHQATKLINFIRLGDHAYA